MKLRRVFLNFCIILSTKSEVCLYKGTNSGGERITNPSSSSVTDERERTYEKITVLILNDSYTNENRFNLRLFIDIILKLFPLPEHRTWKWIGMD